MAIVEMKRCDRCDKLYDIKTWFNADGGFDMRVRACYMIRGLPQNYYREEEFDLCPECVTKLWNFIKEQNDGEYIH